MIKIHLGGDCKLESESENIVKCVYLDVYIRTKASLIACAPTKNIVASSGR